MTDTILQELNLLQSQGGGGGFQSCCYQRTAQTQWDSTQIQIHNVLHIG